MAQGLLLYPAMPALDILRHMDPGQVRARESASAGRTQTSTASLDTAFEDMLDIVNPLQHLPVVGTLYRAITGDQISAIPKIAGDALYGGLWGAVSAVADTAFEAITGKDFGSTMLAMVTDGLGLDGDPKEEAPVQVAQNAATPASTPSKNLATFNATDALGETAFGAALAAKGLDAAVASRAMFAYQRANGLVPASLN